MKSQIDYLRLASWGHEPYVQVMASLMSIWPGDWQRGKWLQYAGWRKEQFFIGMGEQHKKRHAIMQASGTLSQKIFGAVSDYEGWYCTRIDLQRTVKRPDWVELSNLYKLLGKKGVSLISSEENDTLYLGARTSDLFTRLYEKLFEEMYIRLEFELKGSRALMALQALYDGEDCDRIYEYYLDRCRLPKRYIEIFSNCDHEATQLAMTAERSHSNEKKLKWLTSLDSSFRLAIADHEIGETVRNLVRSWSQFADEIDIKADKR
ncbi:hypothetical protein KAR91_87765 [Candidatus Pacearchaeota archaeon]|nr:hypothetical protein [Candidatus Pacearchaeota archaeon]